MVGVSLVGCETPGRTVIVAQTGTANYRQIQPALRAAVPGDVILVRSGTYTEPVWMDNSGTPTAPITLKAYPGERPILRPYSEGATRNVGMNGRWLILDGFEITGGRHGVVVAGANNIVRNSHVHDNGVGCPGEVCGQGILVAAVTDVAITGNQIEQNGLTTSSPWHAHGIYLSNYYGRGVARISVLNNVIRRHGGGGLHVWDSVTPTRTVLVEGNRFEDNAIEAVLTHAEHVVLRRNEFVHRGHPPTDAPRTSVLWLEFSRNLTLEANTIRYSSSAIGGVPSVLIHAYPTDQDFRELVWRNNVWDAPGVGLTDALLNSLRVNLTTPSAPMVTATRGTSNPLLLTWTTGAGSAPDDFTLLVGSSPGGSNLAVVPMAKLTDFSAVAPTGMDLYVRVVARRGSVSAASNDIVLRVGPQTALVVPPPPVMLTPTVTGSTVRISWQSAGANTGLTVLARTAPTGPVAASIPVSAGSTSLTVTGVANGTYYVSVVALNGGLSSVESAVVALTVR